MIASYDGSRIKLQGSHITLYILINKRRRLASEGLAHLPGIKWDANTGPPVPHAKMLSTTVRTHL